jgi:crotonobetainyl-CoA:carnitine CoA-transferase CaiB-like acyl-CoA transferase
MTQVMKGVRILEVAQFTFVPAAGGVLADWGADVIKIEHPKRGDAQRGLDVLSKVTINQQRNMLMHHPNRGKRSVGLDIYSEEGRELLYELAKGCDVFLTNFLPAARRKLKIDVEDIRKANPKIIYARGSAHGDKGPDREKGGFDSSAFWARAGSAALATPAELEGPLGQPGPAYGDSIGAMYIAGGISAALFHRERTGEAVEMDVSLLSSGLWSVGCSVDIAMDLGMSPFRAAMPGNEQAGTNPFIGLFRCADGKHLNLTVLTPGPYIRDTFEHLGLPELADDPRFSVDLELMKNAEAAKQLITAAIAKQPLSYWVQRLSTMAGQWAPVQDPYDLSQDPQVIANEFIFEVDPEDGTGRPLKLVANPVQFDRQPARNTRAPEAWEHTELVLMEMGVEWERIEALKAKGAIA